MIKTLPEGVCSKGTSQTKWKSNDLVGFKVIQSSARLITSFSKDIVLLSIHNSNSDCWGTDIKMQWYQEAELRDRHQENCRSHKAPMHTLRWKPDCSHCMYWGKLSKKTLFKAIQWKFCFQPVTDIKTMKMLCNL